MIPGILPIDLGLPPKFHSWRPGQIRALDLSLDSPARFLAHSMPVGEGKSLYYIAHAILASTRACVLTSSKGLQKQLYDDFSSCGLADMRGRNNYICQNKEAKSCEDGQHYKCPPDDCPYEQARTRMMQASLVQTNYDYFMLSYLYGRGMGDFDLLICDEAHGVADHVCAAMSIKISYAEATKLKLRLPQIEQGIQAWWEWSKLALYRCTDELALLKEVIESEREERGKMHPQTAKDLHFWTRMESKCKAILATEGAKTEWIIERTGDGYKLEPVWAREYAHSVLFKTIPKVILVSATMVKKTLQLLGISDEESAFYEYPSSFPVRRSPVYLWGACKVDAKTTGDQYALWTARIDNIIRARLDRKGIIHSVSYERSRIIQSRSEFSSYMIVPAKGSETTEALRKFKASAPPSVLVSPAITTGYDFPGSQAEYNIIAKTPFLDSRAPVIATRQKEDPEYGAYVTAQTIVQAHGRCMRDEKDQAETVIIDSHFQNWFYRSYRHLFPLWFHRLTQVVYRGMPEPPLPLQASATPLPLTGFDDEPF